MKRRRYKNRQARRNRSITILTLLVCVAVSSGYLGVKHVVAPWMERQSVITSGKASVGTENQGISPDKNDGQSQNDEPKKGADKMVEDKIDTVATTAFAVQFGSFSSEEAANQAVKELEAQGISSEVQLRDNAWKVISEGFATKDEAKAAAIQWRNIVGDAFVVEI